MKDEDTPKDLPAEEGSDLKTEELGTKKRGRTLRLSVVCRSAAEVKGLESKNG
jgi:hypothetical protein